MSRADGGGQRNRLCNVGCGNQFAADRNFDPGNFDPLQEWQRQAEAQNAAPENHPPARMVMTQQPMGRPAQGQQAGPFEQDCASRRCQQKRQVHFDFLWLLLVWDPAAVCHRSLRSAGLRSDVSINCMTSSCREPPAKMRASVCIVVSSSVALGTRAA